jgi:hypothetical protein
MKMKMRSLGFCAVAVFALLFLTALGPPAYACSCSAPGPPCQAYWYADAVFSGTALSVTEIEIERAVKRLVRFRVEEALRGVGGREVEVLTGGWGGDCGYDFQTGTKYLVYGYRVEGQRWIETGVCARTRPLAEADEDLHFIRGLPQAPAGSEIFGAARRHRVDLETGVWDEVGGIPGARVIVMAGERRAEALTGADGSYRFHGLAPGRYTVRVTLPPHLSPQEERTVEVRDRGCARVDYQAVVDGRVSGRLLDARGRSPGVVTVKLLPLAAGKQLRALWELTKRDGSFEFKDLPPGRYVLGVNIDDTPDKDLPYRTTYYPATHARSAAEVFTLGEGQRLTGIKFRLPPPLARRALTGVVVWPDGRPVARGAVSLVEVSSGRPVGMDVKVDARGRFSVEVFGGVRYKVRASVPADPDWRPESGRSVTLLVSPEVEVTPSARTRPLRLVINPPDDNTRRTRVIARGTRP